MPPMLPISPTTAPREPAPVPSLQLHGHPRLLHTPRPLALRHGLALLALLAVSRVPQGRDGLAQRLWPDAPLPTARSRLRRLLNQMRTDTGVMLVKADGDALQLADGVACDWQATRAAIAAPAAASGPAGAPLALLLAPAAGSFLDGFLLGSDAFDDWAEQVRREHQSALVRALEQFAERALVDDSRSAPTLAHAAAAALLRLDGCSEAGHAARLQACARQGDAAGVEAAYHACAQALRDEFGVRPSARLEQAYVQALALLRDQQPEVHYASARDGVADTDPASHIAHVAWGRGPRTVVALWGLMSHVEVALEEPRARAFLDALACDSRVVMLDRRGTGLSERMGTTPGLDSGVHDVLATLDHLGVQRAWLFGSAVGGALALALALRHPERVAGLILYGTSPVGGRQPDAPWGLADEDLQPWLRSLTDPAHQGRSLRCFAPSVADDPAVQRWYARLLRHAATPRAVAAMLRGLQAVDLRPQLGRLRVPALVLHRRGDRLVPLAAGRQLAAALPQAELREFDGDDHFLWYGDSAALLAAVRDFIARDGRERLPVAA